MANSKQGGWRIAVILISILIILPFAACQSPAAPAGQAGPVAKQGQILVTPPSGKAATTITILGAGFAPKERVDLVLTLDGVTNFLGQARTAGYLSANDDGAFTTTSSIPVVAQPGVYTLRANGDKGTVAYYPIQVQK